MRRTCANPLAHACTCWCTGEDYECQEDSRIGGPYDSVSANSEKADKAGFCYSKATCKKACDDDTFCKSFVFVERALRHVDREISPFRSFWLEGYCALWHQYVRSLAPFATAMLALVQWGMMGDGVCVFAAASQKLSSSHSQKE